MALPVVLKSGKNYITLVLDSEMDFAELLQHIVSKFMESEKFFGDQSFAIMFDGRELTDREKLIILDAIDAYTSINITRIIDNDVYMEYVAKMQDSSENDDSNEEFEESSDNCLLIERDVRSGEKICAENNIVVHGNVYSGAILKAGGSIIVLGLLEGQAIAGNKDSSDDIYIMANDFTPENYRIGRVLGKPIKKKGKGISLRRKANAKMAMLIDGEIQIKSI